MPGGMIIPTLDKGPALKPKQLRQAIPAILVGLWAGLGGFLFGYDTGVISGLMEMTPFSQEYGQYFDYNVPTNTISATNPPKPGWALDTGDRSLAVSVLSIGTFFGSLLAAPIGDFRGRKLALMVALFVFAIGVLVQCVSTALPLFCVGRVLAGVGVGLISCLVPLYQSETAPRWIRGAIVGCYQWAITIGLFVASLVNEGTKDRKGKSSYLIPIALQFAWAGVLMLGLIFIPESPRYRMKQGREEDAAKVLAFLSSTTVHDPIVQDELKEIRDNLALELAAGGGGWGELLKNGERKYFKRVATGAAAQALQQLTGINFIFYYGTTFFKSTGPGSKNPFVFSVIANSVNVAATPASFWLIERMGRRNLFMGGALWMLISQSLVAIIGTASSTTDYPAQRAAVGFVCVYIAGFAAGWGPLTWVYTGEIYPLEIRAKGMAVSTATQWIWNFAIGYSTPYLVDKGHGKAGLGPKIFFVWAVACAFCCVFSYFFIYETAGLGLEEIDELHANSTGPSSVKYNNYLKEKRAQKEAEAAGKDDGEHIEMKGED